MIEYFLNLVGLRILLRSSNKITISNSLRPFLCEPHNLADCIITIQPRKSLPEFSENGIFHGLEYYDSYENVSRIFHCNSIKADAFAVTELLENGNIEIGVLPEYLSYFEGSSGIFNRIGMETLLQRHYGLLLHASLIKFNNKAIAFTGPSGIGKSTHAELWRTYLSADIINGDRAAIRKTENVWIAYGSPYAGTSAIYKNDNAPLAAIVVLRQAQENRLKKLSPAEAFIHIYPELSMHNWDKAFVERATDICTNLLTEIPVYLLECLPEESAVQIVKKGLGL